MKIDAWKEYLEAIGVIVSLLFVVYEINQNTSVAGGQTRSDLSALNQEWLALIADEKNHQLWTKVWIEPR